MVSHELPLGSERVKVDVKSALNSGCGFFFLSFSQGTINTTPVLSVRGIIKSQKR